MSWKQLIFVLGGMGAVVALVLTGHSEAAFWLGLLTFLGLFYTD